jgi:tetratricopeptide (TPR) repeat protein
MFYFFRTVILFLILFVGISLGIHWGASHYFQPNMTENDGDILPPLLPRSYSMVRDTQAGLILAGMSAQNNRDWAHAWKNFAALNDQFETNPQTALRAMTLAMGNGDFAQVEKIAGNLHDTYFTKSNQKETTQDAFDLARLFLVVQAVHKNDLAQAKILNESMEKSILARFVLPIVDAWLSAEMEPTKINESTQGLSDTQIVYKALAAKYAGQDDVYKVLQSKISNPKLIEVVEGNPPKTIQDALAMAFHDLAKAMLNERAVDSALLFAQMATYLSPDLTFIYATIGDILSYQKQDEGALRSYAKVLSSEDTYQRSLAKRVDILLNQDQFEDAVAIVKKAQENTKGNKADIYYLLGNIYRADKQFEKALSAYDQAEVMAKESNDGELPQGLWPLYYSRAIVLDLMDRWEEAEKDLLIAMDKFPNSPVILNYIGYAYADRDIELEKAKDMLSQAVIIAPNDSFIVDSMGWILFRMGDYGQAVKYLERAASLRPYHMVINDHLGDAYWKLGRQREAHYMWQRASDYYDDSDEEQVRMIPETHRKLKQGL